MTDIYSRIARLSVRRRWWFIGAWLAVVVLALVGASQAERALKVGGFSLPGTEFHEASAILSDDLNISSDKAALVVFHSDTLKVTDKAFYDSVERALTNLSGNSHVTKVESFYTAGIPDMVSADNHTTYAWVTLEGTEDELEEATPELRALVRSDDVEVFLIGQAAANFDIEKASAEDLARVE
ncbi:MAG: MMPL family transporter, partial [Chloroflexi bacterium]|nr:MMPL family transporter [Chloroflexota bacterium]